VTATTTGFSKRASVKRKRPTGVSSTALAPPPSRPCCMKSLRSFPEVKMPGCPVKSTARTALSSVAASSASDIAVYIAGVSAFFFSGRAISMVATPLRTAVLMLMPLSS
jgi:hypothetical protein